ncbi:MAG: phosphatidyl-myo-inositol dimannoside synthase [Solirubrobacteraceae bacterium]|nr:phosphatidyl-myo-inositol dimannoside synthase [Solirubrobacteraceae bacterium]
MVTPDYPPAVGGIQRLLHRATSALPNAETRVVTLRSDGWREFDRANPQPTRRFPRAPGAAMAANAAFNAQAVTGGLRWRPDVILNGHVVTGPACAALARRYRVPSVVYAYAKEIDGRPGLAGATVRASAGCIAISAYTRQLVAGVAGERTPIHVIPPGVDVPPQPGAADAAAPTIVTVGRLRDSYKGHDVMLDALVAVRRAVPDVRWIVLGDGRLREALAAKATALGLGDAVEFRGAVSDAERDRCLAGAHVFAMPSRYPPAQIGGEGFGIVYLEAAAWGLPAVAGDVGGPRDAVEHEATGLLVDPEDAASVAASLVRLLSDLGYARRLGLRGRERASEQFTWDAIGARVEDVLRTHAFAAA